MIFFDFSQKSALLLIFFSHGIVFTSLLLYQGLKHDRKSSLWLAAFIFLCCLYIAPFMLGYAGWYGMTGYRQFLFYAPLQQLFLLGPVMYFYVHSLISTEFKLLRKHYLHFIPAGVYFLYSLFIFFADNFLLSEIYYYADGRDKDFATWYQVAGLISMFAYFSLSLKLYRRYKKLAFQVVSYAESILHRWIERYLSALLIILILRVLFFILNPEWGQFGSKFWYYLCFSILFYYISVAGYIRALQIISQISIRSSIVPLVSIPVIDSNIETSLSEYNVTSQLIPDVDKWKAKLEYVMQTKKIYTNPELTLVDVATVLEVTAKLVSQTVNQGFKMNFNDYVNSHRTRAVIEKLNMGEYKTKTLLALALECGFNSKSTFNRAFKKESGMTPKDYLIKTQNLGAKA